MSLQSVAHLPRVTGARGEYCCVLAELLPKVILCELNLHCHNRCLHAYKLIRLCPATLHFSEPQTGFLSVSTCARN